MKEIISQWIALHGYVGLFSLLVLGIVGLPVPDEWLLMFSGYLVFKHTFRFAPAVAAAFLGSSCGISVSYLLGSTLGNFVVEKYGRYVHITHEHVERVHRWFDRLGRWTLPVGYFIPGVRHLTGYVAGTSRLRYRTFALFAYTGAFFWSLTFVTTGYVLGEQWSSFSESLHEKLLIIAGVILAVVICYLIYVLRPKRGVSQ